MKTKRFQPTTKEPGRYTPSEVARELGLESAAAARRLMVRGPLECYRIGGRLVVTQDQLDAFRWRATQ